jgi:endonuclease-3
VHEDPWQLLVATILSAQCTDARVNLVTPGFFARWPRVEAVAGAEVAEVAQEIRSTGFYQNKAKSLVGAARAIVERHGGQVPDRMEALRELPGVGRKTANVVLGEIWNRPEGVVVDTHVGRISFKLGLTDQTDPQKIEAQLAEAVDRSDWRDFGHLIIDHGRQTCRARTPRCDECPLYAHCEVRA